ncbi:MAG: hypothetical protein ACRCZI_02105, partial [Cetobacterium sp.]
AWMQRFGVSKPIYCWTHPAYVSDTNTYLDGPRYERHVRQAYQGCDGVILWDWFSKSYATESAKSWWQSVFPHATERAWRHP